MDSAPQSDKGGLFSGLRGAFEQAKQKTGETPDNTSGLAPNLSSTVASTPGLPPLGNHSFSTTTEQATPVIPSIPAEPLASPQPLAAAEPQFAPVASIVPVGEPTPIPSSFTNEPPITSSGLSTTVTTEAPPAPLPDTGIFTPAPPVEQIPSVANPAVSSVWTPDVALAPEPVVTESAESEVTPEPEFSSQERARMRKIMLLFVDLGPDVNDAPISASQPFDPSVLGPDVAKTSAPNEPTQTPTLATPAATAPTTSSLSPQNPIQ